MRLQAFFSGRVQGVGFRYTTQRIAGEFQISGWVRNRSDGRVELVAEGEQAEVERFVEKLAASMSENIEKFERACQPETGEFSGFDIKSTF